MIRGLYGGSQDDVIYFEKQASTGRMCALHCLNNLIQGPEFTAEEMTNVGAQLDFQESSIGGLSSNYANASADGYYSISVIETCLMYRGYTILPLANPIYKDLHHDPAKYSDAYVCNLHHHWFTFRPVHKRWFRIDSLQPSPEPVPESTLSGFIDSLQNSSYSVFVVRHTGWPKTLMPEPQPKNHPNIPVITSASSSGPLPQGTGVFLSFNAASEYASLPTPDHHHSGGGGNGADNSAAPSTNIKPSTAIFAGQGRAINDTTRVGSGGGDYGDESRQDDELAEVLRASAQTFREGLPEPPPEPANDGIRIRVVDSRGKNKDRRFHPSHTVEDLIRWVEKYVMEDSVPCLGALEEITLVGPAGFEIARSRISGKDLSISKRETSGAPIQLVAADTALSQLFATSAMLLRLRTRECVSH